MTVSCELDSVVKKRLGPHGSDLRGFINTIPWPAWGICWLQDLAS